MRKKKQPRTEELGIRELKSRASEIVRAVKEERARFVITQRGKPAAIIAPLDAAPASKSADEVWERLQQLGEEIGKGWQSALRFGTELITLDREQLDRLPKVLSVRSP